MEDQNLSSQGQDGLAGEVMESLGEPKEGAEKAEEAYQGEGEGGHDDLPSGVKERLGRQERRHQRELKNMRAQLEHLQSKLSSQPNMEKPSSEQAANPYNAALQGGNVDEQIHKAVSYALQHKEMEQRKAQEQERLKHVHKQYEGLNKHLDDTADKYEDFDDVVRGQDVPFTPHMRDAALMLPRKGPGSAGEVLYKLGKNPSELERISKLHPLDQASELIALSHALINAGGEQKSSQPRHLGQIKSNPVTNSHVVTDKTPVSELRKRMKAGWK
jgi:Skp family chaperone for outer membrane proteins